MVPSAADGITAEVSASVIPELLFGKKVALASPDKTHPVQTLTCYLVGYWASFDRSNNEGSVAFVGK